MFKNFKRIAAGLVSSAVIITSAGCTLGKNTAYALTVDGYKIKAGVYIYYTASAMSEATNLALKQDENLDTKDKDALKKIKIEGKDFVDFVKDKATENCVNHVATIKHFDELELELTETQENEIDQFVDMNWESNEDMFDKNGISKESLEEVVTSSYKSEEVFKAYYGEGGSEKIEESQLKEYYTENNARVRYIDMDLHDAEGNDLDEAGKKEIEDMANDFLKRAKAAKDEKAMLEEFDAFQEEYDEYVADQAAEAAGEEATDESTTEAPTEEETEAETTAAETEAEEDNDTESDIDEQVAEAATDNDVSDEETDNPVTTAPASEDAEAETTTTVNPYANETIIHVVTTTEGQKEEDVTYNPSKECYNWIFNDAKQGVPDIVKDEHTMYVIVRLDINERMTDEDLWDEEGVEDVRYEMFSDEFQDMLDSWGDEYEVVKNKKAYKKYDPLKIETNS